MAKNLVTLNVENVDYSIRPHATCNSSSATVDKSVAIADFNLCTGATVLVKFSNGNKANDITLDVNETGAKPVKCVGNVFDPNLYYEFMYDGTNWVLIGNEKKRCAHSSGNKNNYPYHRIAYTDVLKSSYQRRTIVLILHQAIFGGKYGELVINVNSNATDKVASYEAYWIMNKGFDADDIKIGVNNTFGDTYFDVFYKMPTGWSNLLVDQKTAGYDSYFYNSWSLCTSQEVSDTTETDKLTSFECYKTVEAAATEIHGKAYTAIVSPNVSSGTLGKITFNGDLTGNAATATKATTADNATNATNAISAENASTATNLAAAPEIETGTNNTIKVKVGNKTSKEYTVPFATNAATATNLAAAPEIETGTNNTIKVKIGDKTSKEYTVPFATNATNATNAVNAEKATTADNAANANKLNDIQYFTYKFNDFDNKNIYPNGASGATDGDDTYVLIANLSDWVNAAKKYCNHYLIGTIYGNRNDKVGTSDSNANTHSTEIYNITAVVSTYNGQEQFHISRLNISNISSIIGGTTVKHVEPCIVEYNSTKYLAFKKTGSSCTIKFTGLMGGIMNQNDWIEIACAGGKVPTSLTILPNQSNQNSKYIDYTVNYKNSGAITTETYYDGTDLNTLLHAKNYADYTVKKDGTGATGTWDIDILGNAVSAEKAGSVNNNLVIKLNGGSTENTDKFTFDGSSAKTINITPSSIGADLEIKGTAPISASKTNKTVTISHNDSTVTAGNYGEANNKSVLQNKTTDYQNSFNVPYLTVDKKGHITQIKNSRITLPTNMDTDVAWSTKSLNGTLSPIDTAMDGQWSANRLSFMPLKTENRVISVTAANANKNNVGKGEKINYTVTSEDVIIEYTDNADAADEKDINWQTYPNIVDSTKTSLITTGLTNPSFYLGGNNNVSQNKDKHRLRVTLTAQSGITYFDAKKVYIYMSQSGASDCKVLVEKSNCGVYPNLNSPDTYPDDISTLKVTDASNGAWDELGTYNISGWAGWNSIPLNVRFGGGLNQVSNVRKIRLTFYFNAYSTNYGPEATNPVKCAIHKIAMVGPTSWSNSGGSFAATGHLYSWNTNKDALFPGGIVPTTNNTGFLGSSTYMWNSANIGTIYENNKKLSEKYAAIGHSHPSFETLTVTNLTANNLTVTSDTSDVKFNAGLNIKNDINFTSIGNNDKFISFKYNDTPQFGWRIGYLGVGTGEKNYLAFQSGGIIPNTTDTWTDALKFGCDTLNATFGGNILPSITNTKDLGSSTLSWNDVYAKTIYENGNSLSNTYAAKTHNHNDNYYTQAQTDEKLTNLQNLINALSSGLKVTGSASPSTFFTGVKTNVTVTATVQNVDSIADANDTIKINSNIATKNTTNKTASFTFSGDAAPDKSTTYSIVAKIKGMTFNSSASVTTRHPIFYGMDEAAEGYPKNLENAISSNKISYTSPGSSAEITGTLMKRDKYRTSARDYSYEEIVNTIYNSAKFFLLVPTDVTQPLEKGFTMGGSPFEMTKLSTTKNYTINGKSVAYYIYRSDSPFGINGSVILSLAK